MRHTRITKFADPRPTHLARGLRREQTSAEAMLWKRLRRNQLDGLHFRRQQRLGPYIADFFCELIQLAIEVDGGVHQRQQDYDALRDEELVLRGVRVVRLSNEEVLFEIENVLQRLMQIIDEQRTSLRVFRREP